MDWKGIRVYLKMKACATIGPVMGEIHLAYFPESRNKMWSPIDDSSPFGGIFTDKQLAEATRDRLSPTVNR